MAEPTTRRSLLAGLAPAACALADKPGAGGLLAGQFRWIAGPPLFSAADRDGDRYHAIKDPTVVRHNGRWHLFCTLRGKNRSHQIEYLSLADWGNPASSRRVTLRLSSGYYCAPQVFFFRPQRTWYLIYQVDDPSRQPSLQPAYSTTKQLDDPFSWTPPRLLFADASKGVRNWIDFWVISDSSKAHLFFTTLDGHMWRSETRLEAFPDGWGLRVSVLEDDIFEASHTYRLKGLGSYLTIVEAQGEGGRRYYKAYWAPRLDGQWKPLAASPKRAFAFPGNVTFTGERWTDSFSHGELLRASNDETLTVDPAGLRFLIQGVTDAARRGKNYGEIPWRLGLLIGEEIK